MRFIVFGVGAIGGTLAVKLALSGFEVVGVARGAQLAAIEAHGLRLRTPDGDLLAKFPVVGSAKELDFRADDVIFLTVKSQDSAGALISLRDAGVRHQTIVCAQNGVANEAMALRYFDNVLGAVVMLPATYMVAGEVIAFSTPKHGILEIGCYPRGLSGAVAPICAALDTAGFAAFAHEDVMRAKFGKLFLNLANGVDSALGAAARDGKYAQMARAEAKHVYSVAGIEYDDVGAADPRRQKLMHHGEVKGAPRVGSSAAQSLARGAGSIEVDYLNGEIAYLGRLHGVPTPVNSFFTELAARLMREGAQPGSLSEAEVDRLYAGWQGR